MECSTDKIEANWIADPEQFERDLKSHYNNKKVLFATAMRMGDCLHLLPIISWYCKTYDIKIDWAICDKTPYYKELVEILSYEKYINKVHIYEFSYIKKWVESPKINCCFRPYSNVSNELNLKFNNYYDNVYCFGFDENQYYARSIKFFSDHFAEEHGFGVDYDYKLNYGNPDYTYKDNCVKIDKLYEPQIQNIDAINLDESNSIIRNLQLCAGAKEVITVRTGAAIALSLARIPFKIKFIDYDYEWYKNLCHTITGGIDIIS